ncbi:MAG: class I SAM-dependent methyltransferase [Phycisphaeraceae bacterium]|nr:class I SAM-dependent methyltransferase [Phycisphaeraceae bacterium]
MATANLTHAESARTSGISVRPAALSARFEHVYAPSACESVYASAEGDHSLVPWARLGPDPTLLRWLNSIACEHVRPGARVIVTGCGLGDDVAELNARGFDAIGLDASPSALAWASRRFPALADGFVLADIASTPPRLQRRFDLVVDVDTLQTAAGDQTDRETLARGLTSLLHPHGALLVVAGAGPIGEDQSADWIDHPMRPEDVVDLMHVQGLEPASPVPGPCEDDATGRFAIVFRRSR